MLTMPAISAVIWLKATEARARAGLTRGGLRRLVQEGRVRTLELDGWPARFNAEDLARTDLDGQSRGTR